MVTIERKSRRDPGGLYNETKVEIENSLANPPDDFDELLAVFSRVTNTIYYENQDLFSTVGRLYWRLTGRSLAELEAKPFADFLVEARIIPVLPQVQGPKKNKSGSCEKYYVLRSQFDEAEERLRALCASRKGKESAF